MNTGKRTFADVLKNPSAALNPGMDPQPLIRKDQRVRLSEDAKKNLRAAIKGKPMILHAKSSSPIVKVGDVKASAEPPKVMKSSQPVVLATASDWVVPGSVMRSVFSDMKDGSNQFSSVHVLKSDEIGAIVREGRRENPIDICDDSDEGELSCHEDLAD